jgi:predicted nucleotidyltransferase
MKTIMKTGAWKILKEFYNNGNSALHLRDIARKTKMNESSVSRHLNFLVKDKILSEELDGNMRKFCIAKLFISKIFPLYDSEVFDKLPLLRKNAIKLYIEKLGEKPVMLVVFGSTSKGTYRQDSDIDILEIVNSMRDNAEAKKFAEAQTGIRIQVFQITLDKFEEELKMKKDKVVLAAVETGFPVFNNKYYYEVIYG